MLHYMYNGKEEQKDIALKCMSTHAVIQEIKRAKSQSGVEHEAYLIPIGDFLLNRGGSWLPVGKARRTEGASLETAGKYTPSDPGS